MSIQSVLHVDALLPPVSEIEQKEGYQEKLTEARIDLEKAYRSKNAASVKASEGENEMVKWPTVIDHATAYITHGGRDIEVIGILMEALVRHAGYIGLRDGLHVLCRCLQHHWEELLLQYDEDREEALEICAVRLDALADGLDDCLPDIGKEPNATHNRAESADLFEELDALGQQLLQIIDDRLGAQQPDLTHLTDAIRKGGIDVARGDDGAPAATRAPATAVGVLPELQSREQALEQLSRLASYFQVTEPLGPISPLLEVAVRWGSMGFAQWLTEVMRDERMIETPSEVLGLLYAEAAKRSDEESTI